MKHLTDAEYRAQQEREEAQRHQQDDEGDARVRDLQATVEELQRQLDEVKSTTIAGGSSRGAGKGAGKGRRKGLSKLNIQLCKVEWLTIEVECLIHSNIKVGCLNRSTKHSTM